MRMIIRILTGFRENLNRKNWKKSGSLSANNKYNKRPAAGIILSQEVFPVSKSAASGCKILSYLFSLVHMFFCNSIQQFRNRLGGVHLLALTHGINISLTVKIKFLYLLNQKIGA